MMKYCDVCGQSYGEALASCPHCAESGSDAAMPAAVNGYHKDGRGSLVEHEHATVSDPEIDLGSPVTTNQPAALGPPSGASFNSWADLTPGEKPLQPGEKPRPRLIPQGGETMVNEAHIDLDQTPGPSSDPPSGASIASWANRVPPRELPPQSPEISPPQTARGLMETSPGPAVAGFPRPTSRGLEPSSLLLGVGLGLGLALLLWLVGVEPPQAWRQPVQHWLGTTSHTAPTTGTAD